MTYASDFAAAIERTRRLGLGDVPFKPVTQRLLTPEAIEELGKVVQAQFQGLDPKVWTEHCFVIHNAVAQSAAAVLNAPTYLTVGDVQVSGQWVYGADEDRIAELAKAGEQDGNLVALHAWITLPSMEIMDLTLATSIGIQENMPELIGSAILKHCDELSQGLAYRPLVVGTRFLTRIGALLDQDAEE